MKLTLTILVVLFFKLAFAQTIQPDSVKKLNEVTIRGYYNSQTILRSVAAVKLIDSNILKNEPNSSLVSTFNGSAGVRMEERSPGSYRLSLRGSLLRSPFGIRNIKIYLDDFPLTDAGGNTYLNLLDPIAIEDIEIYKGPEASIFGANTGGAVLISTTASNQNKLSASLTGGSYGLLHETASIQRQFKNYSFSFVQGYQKSSGYRENSAMGRKYFQTNQQLKYAENSTLKLLAFYSDLNYETPGGLTLGQLEQNPKLARPATATLPGALTQQAAIYNKTVFVGLSNDYEISKNFKHVIALFGSYTDFKNPFITNYEKRFERTLGFRTFLAFEHQKEAMKFNGQAGVEYGATKTQVKNFDNNAGSIGPMQAEDILVADQDFAFLRLNFDYRNKLLVELSGSLNFYKYQYESFFPSSVALRKRKFDPELMPKLAASYLLTKELSIRGSVSKGYSPPTVAEVRSSDQIINNNLQAEIGWNYEAGLRYQSINRRFYANASVFQFNLNRAIVRRLNANDTEYFVNAGATRQQGLELETAVWLLKGNQSLLQGLELRNTFTYNHFNFIDYTIGNANFSNNKLTGVPDQILVSSLAFEFRKGIYLFAQHNYTSSLPLNDANTTFAKGYNLIAMKSGIRDLKIKKSKLELFFGINNLLDENYSLGNDLNAVGGRYYNAAPGRNFYLGTSIRL
ncbi:TonB-dependent receptor [Pedobacter sandarakinus]|uniref:TonB-dependent receptor n=1 Tax=Pedobacter sandarakinus TaxID=353156 RepID=UPI00224540E0|nr:TonB-dependent receptor [Pedobacter sandarakinus]MCX2574655.1 TonB-dependent receptor [Pedobacter sandarakinus]